MAVVPKFETAWWKKNKSKTLGKIGMSEALRQYEVAIETQNFAEAHKAMAAIKKAASKGLVEANQILHKGTVEILYAYLALVPKEDDRISKLAQGHAAAEKKAAAKAKDEANAVPVQKQTGPVVIWHKDLGADVKKILTRVSGKLRGTKVEVKGYWVELTLDGSLVTAMEAEGDLVIPAFMVEDAQKLAEKALLAIDKHCDMILAGRHDGAKLKAIRGLQEKVDSELTAVKSLLERVPEKRWKAFVAKHKQYSDYKFKSGLKLTLGALSIAGAAASLAGAAATGGASLPLSIIALSRSLLSVTTQLAHLCHDAEKVRKNLVADCESLLGWYHSKGQRLLNETSGAVVKGVLGVDPNLAPTISTVEKSYDLWSNKIAGYVVGSRKASKNVLDLMKACDAYASEVQKQSGKEAQQAMAKLNKARAALDGCLTQIGSLAADVKKFERDGPGLKKVIEKLRTGNSQFSNIFEKAFPLAINLALIGTSAGKGFAKADDALEYAHVAIDLFKGLAKEGAGQAGVI